MRFSRTAIASPFIATLVLGLIVGTPAALVAQVTSGSINGTVTRMRREVCCPVASVTVTNPATGITRIVSTNDAGDFVVPNLPPGA